MSDKSSLDANKGSVGKEFTPQGKAGGTAQEIGMRFSLLSNSILSCTTYISPTERLTNFSPKGGPFDKEGAIGKQFTPEGSVGGTAQSAAQQMQGEKKPVFDKDGAVGKQFKPDGAIGSVGEKVGGPFASDGAVGKHFNPDGTVGGTVQENLGSGKK
ncbi:hypothetical protein H2202_006844 [Exophiala xenobiotica]|nr:hypothetical protein H2202_006844 [Exophiala xenobiotica]